MRRDVQKGNEANEKNPNQIGGDQWERVAHFTALKNIN